MKKMKKGICFTGLVMVLLFGLMATSYAGTAHTFDIQGYKKLAKTNIGRLLSGNVNAGTMNADMEKLIALGILGAKEHMTEPETPPEEAKLLEITIANINKMSNMSLEDIESQWHKGGFLKTQEIDINKYDHFSEVMCHYDALVHPATVIICLKKYQQSHNEDLLEQSKDELMEVVEHMKHLE